MNLPAINNDLPNIATAKLPASYESAKTALAQCSKIDECQDWADKAAALASYAKQASDKGLMDYAMRIQARAIRRCGELLKQVEGGQGARNDLELHEGNQTKLTRKQTGDAAGLSNWQRHTALRVATVSEDQFNEAIESDNPPTVSKIAEIGTQKKPLVDLGGIPPENYKEATTMIGTVSRLYEFIGSHDPLVMAKSIQAHEKEKIKGHLDAIERWVDVFITNLGE